VSGPEPPLASLPLHELDIKAAFMQLAGEIIFTQQIAQMTPQPVLPQQ